MRRGKRLAAKLKTEKHKRASDAERANQDERKQAVSGAHEKLEHAEHAAHGPGHEGSNKLYGVTMACIGVLIAVSSAMVGSERNELTRAMIEQTQAHADYSGASTKLRIVMIELEKQHARVASAKDPPGGWSPVPRFIELASDYKKERDLAKTWADSYHPVIEGHFDAAESYERGQLIAEIGIVLASLAVLLGSRPAWMLSVVMSVACVAQLGRTFVHTGHVVTEALVKVGHAEDAYQDLRKAHTGVDEDQKAIEQLDADGSIRSAIQARHNSREPGALETNAKKSE